MNIKWTNANDVLTAEYPLPVSIKYYHNDDILGCYATINIDNTYHIFPYDSPVDNLKVIVKYMLIEELENMIKALKE